MVTTNTKNKKNITEFLNTKSTIQFIILVIAVAAAYYIGSLSSEVKFYKKNIENLQANPQAAIGNNQVKPQEPEVGDVPEPTENDKIRGNTNSKIALIEYSDYDCPYCSTFHETAKKVVDENEIQWIYRHFPLSQIHPNAEKKAIASECVLEQGGMDKFWEFSDILFAQKPTVEQLASIVGTQLALDQNEFQDCLDNEKTIEKVMADLQSGLDAGVNGTPGNFIMNLDTGNIMPLRGAVPPETLEAAIKAI